MSDVFTCAANLTGITDVPLIFLNPLIIFIFQKNVKNRFLHLLLVVIQPLRM